MIMTDEMPKINSIDEILDWKSKIDKMSQLELCRLLRFAKVGHPCFDTTKPEISNYFSKKYEESGGMTPEISKQLGWE